MMCNFKKNHFEDNYKRTKMSFHLQLAPLTTREQLVHFFGFLID